MSDSNTRKTENAFQKRWGDIYEVRSELAEELNQMANDLPGQASKQLRALGRWFNGPADYQDALRRADVLSICLPLTELDASVPISRADIARSARAGFCSLTRNASASRRWTSLLIYPFLLMVSVAALAIGYSFWISPEFEAMFAEFEIELPAVTNMTFRFAAFIRDFWWLLLSLFLILGIGLTIFNRSGSDRRPFGLSWFDQTIMSARNAAAAWAWHISLLLEAGLTQKEAVQTAGAATNESWLKEKSRTLADKEWLLQPVVEPVEVVTESDIHSYALDEPTPKPTTNKPMVFVSPKLRLLDSALRLPLSDGKIAVLQEVANYYWDRNTSDWWMQCLVSLIIWAIGLSVAFVVLALFTPLLAIISGLTGKA